MSELNSDIFLNAQEKYAYKELFKVADVQNKLFLRKQEAMAFFANAGIPNELLEEIWYSIDRENKEYITETEFYVFLKLIACAQNGVESNENILSTQVPLPHFRGISIKPENSLEIEPITATEREKYIGIFQSCNLVDGLLYGDEAQHIFMKSRLPIDKLNSIWMLADTRKSGTLNKTEFIIAMHYISRLLSNPTLTLPQTLPSQTYVEATGKFASSIRRNNTTTSPVIRKNNSLGYISSPLTSHINEFTTPLNNMDGANSSFSQHINEVILTPNEIEKYRVFFHQLDKDNSGYIDADEAVYFFNHSHLPDSELGLIWEIADSKHLGKLDLHDFSVAMHLIGMRKNNQSINHYIKQQTTQYQPSQTTLDHYQQTNLMNQRYELENQLVEFKQQSISQQQLVDSLVPQLEELKTVISDLESKVSTAKNELNTARIAAEDAENEVEILKRKRDRLLGHGIESVSSTPTKGYISSLPELTRASSTLSGSTIMSPRSEKDPGSTLFNPFNGFNKSNQETTTATNKTPSSSVQTKSVSKYGFDITMFDTLSLTDGNKQVSTSINDDLATLFNAPIPPNDNNVKSSNFDSVFM